MRYRQRTRVDVAKQEVVDLTDKRCNACNLTLAAWSKRNADTATVRLTRTLGQKADALEAANFGRYMGRRHGDMFGEFSDRDAVGILTMCDPHQHSKLARSELKFAAESLAASQ